MSQPRQRTRPRLPRKVLIAVAVVGLLGGGGAGAYVLTTDSGEDFAATARPSTPTPTPAPVDPAVQAREQRRQAVLALDRASRTGGGGKADGKLAWRVTPTPTTSPSQGALPPLKPVSPGTARAIARELMPKWGFDVESQFGCLDRLWERESHWDYRAYNEATGAGGIPQALPMSKMASAGDDWRTNPATQIKWGLGYIKGRYGNPCGAWNHFLSVGWY